MIYINLDKVIETIPQTLLDAVDEAKAELLDATPEERSAVIDKYSKVWSDLKEYFENYRKGKCWYTESNNPGSSKDMDHFRPKQEVYEDDGHPGYWWLAFDVDNYRFSCQFSNRLKKDPSTKITGGKGTHFPVKDEQDRAQEPDDETADEKHVLLDPINPLDVRLLWFLPDGTPTISPQYEADNFCKKRIEDSIRYMNINYGSFNDERKRLFTTIRREVKDANICYRK